jgi:ABC-type sugar transport system, periplasmic component
MKMKKVIAMLLTTVMTIVLLAGCQDKSTGDISVEGSQSEKLSGTLTFAIWDNNLNDFLELNDMVGKFKEAYPNIDIEVEKIKDDSEYWNSMKMRSSANQLPDIMCNKTFTLARFKDYLLDLSDTEAAKNNELAKGYAIDGEVLGVPMVAACEYVYYWKDMFKEAGVEVPTTWGEFEMVAQKLQDFYGNDNKDFMAIAIGLKDEWPTYPFMEFMPALESGNGGYWNEMATQDEPFVEGTDINNAYQKIYNLFSSGVLGRDPLGLGQNQVTELFCAKNAAIMLRADNGLRTIQNGTDDISELGTFYLPTRNSESEPYNIIIQGDTFVGVTTHSKNQEAALAFVEWYYSEAWYPEYIAYVTSESSMTNFPKEKDSVLKEADELSPDGIFVMYDGGGDDFTALQNEVAFDYKKLGAQMLIEGFDLDKELEVLNVKWTQAREKLNIK